MVLSGIIPLNSCPAKILKEKPLHSGTKLTFTAADQYNNVSKAVTASIAEKRLESSPGVFWQKLIFSLL